MLADAGAAPMEILIQDGAGGMQPWAPQQQAPLENKQPESDDLAIVT